MISLESNCENVHHLLLSVVPKRKVSAQFPWAVGRRSIAAVYGSNGCSITAKCYGYVSKIIKPEVFPLQMNLGLSFA